MKGIIKMNNIFKETINGIESWDRIRGNTDIFLPLIKYVCKKENIKFENAQLQDDCGPVYKLGDKIIKIYDPKEVGGMTDGYNTELNELKRAKDVGISVPKIISNGIINDKYVFPYIIMEYIKGTLASQTVKNFSYEKKKEFAQDIKSLLSKYNTTVTDININLYREKNIPNNIWDIFPPIIKNQVREAYNNSSNFNDFAHVYGDMHGNNIIIDKEGNINLIDLADAVIAPKICEYESIIFGLFECDKTMIREFRKDIDNFEEKLFLSVIYHRFGAFSVENICKKYLNIEKSEFTDIQILKEFISYILI